MITLGIALGQALSAYTPLNEFSGLGVSLTSILNSAQTDLSNVYNNVQLALDLPPQQFVNANIPAEFIAGNSLGTYCVQKASCATSFVCFLNTTNTACNSLNLNGGGITTNDIAHCTFFL